MSEPDLRQAVQTTLGRCLGVQPGEDVLVVADAERRDIGHALRDAGRAHGRRRHAGADHGPRGQRRGAAAQRRRRAGAPATSSSRRRAGRSRHTQARKAATDAGARGATMPGVTRDMLARLMAADFDAMARRSRRGRGPADAADEAHVTCPLGTDLRIDLTRPHRDRRRRRPDRGAARSATCPAARASSRPVGGEGTLVASVLAAIGLADPPAG